MQFADLKTRSITAGVLIGVLILLEMSRGIFPMVSVAFPIIALILVVGCSIEFVAMCSREGERCIWYHLPLVSPSVILCLSSFKRFGEEGLVSAHGEVLASGVFGLGCALTLLLLAGRRSLEAAKKTTFDIFLGTFLFGFGGASLVSLSAQPSHVYLYLVIIIVAAHDSCAYFVGKMYGKHRLSEAISPGKSIEGSLGGLGAAILLSVIGGKVFLSIPISRLVIIGFVFVAFATFFDIGKSFIKRVYGVKDSGTILPGHGGLIDRLDGIFGGALAAQMIMAFFQ